LTHTNPTQFERPKSSISRTPAVLLLLLCLIASGLTPRPPAATAAPATAALAEIKPSFALPPSTEVLSLAGAPSDSASDSHVIPSHSDRFGYGVSPAYGMPSDYDVGRLRGGWYVDWEVRLHPQHPAGLDHAQMIWTSRDKYHPDAETIVAVAQANPGALWLIGNEPDCIYQGNSTPDQYARLYRELYTLIKMHDPASQIAIGGIVQATPLRLQWLDAVLERYQALYGERIPVDVWNIHAFLLNEEKNGWGCEIPPGIDALYGELRGVDDHDRMDLFAEQIVRFRRWMADQGERDKPLIVSEYGILMVYNDGFDWPRVQAFMRGTFDYFMTAVDDEIGYPADGNRLVQRWAWYSLNDKRFEGYTTFSHLFDPSTKQITPLGLDFESYVGPLFTPYVDLTPLRLDTSPAAPLSSDGGPVTVTLTATVLNAGNVDAQNVSLRFWHTSPDQANQIGEVLTLPLLPARSLESVSVAWPGVAVGGHTVGVTVDQEAAIAESDEGNNTRTRSFVVADRQTYLSLILQER
jgi:hypothetical protein